MDYQSMIQSMMQARQPQQQRPPSAGMLPPGMGMNAQPQRPQGPPMGTGQPLQGMQQLGGQMRQMMPGQPPTGQGPGGMGMPSQQGNPYGAMVQQAMQGQQQRPAQSMGGPPPGYLQAAQQQQRPAQDPNAFMAHFGGQLPSWADPRALAAAGANPQALAAGMAGQRPQQQMAAPQQIQRAQPMGAPSPAQLGRAQPQSPQQGGAPTGGADQWGQNQYARR